MKTETFAINDWDDLVFENRNKAYGAYEVRKSYSNNLVAGFSVSIGLSILVFIIPILSSFMSEDIIADVKPIVTEDETIIFEQQPYIPEPLPPQPQVRQAAAAAVSDNLQVQVTTAEVETIIPTNADIVTSVNTGDDAGTGEATPYTGTGQGVELPSDLPAPTGPVTICEIMPAYDGGMDALYEFIKRKVRYPASARRLGIEGTVYVSFVVNSEGKVVDVKTVRGISADCDKEAERVISLLSQWKSGVQNHRPVSVRMTLPIKFQLAK
ncbi:energy transducer TonB [Ohtaekwangia koreensis]|uniref:Protein TonB n=1 Tax=Ohtaekwangia koreensis TaxID=688867 RepID=A0A1T5M4J4_9BACT|nr:energy transducer TonB [Ohtaekwangia koreensis]SKC83161.1 protein TonB [Ohtaekwangia koreensis]